MRKLFAWLGVAMLTVLLAPDARAGEPLKPFVVMILDTSGSMNAATGSGPPSCGGLDQRIDHATCAINRIVNSYGDMVFALGRFREVTSGGASVTSCDANNNNNGNPNGTLPTPSGGDVCGTQGVFCGNCDESTGLGDTCDEDDDCSAGATCVAGRCAGIGLCTSADREFELLTPLVDGNNHLAAFWTDGTCGSCTTPTPGTDPTGANEIWGVSPNTFTPLASVLKGAKLYWLGQMFASDGTTVIWPNTADGFAPIANDVPTNAAFFPKPGKPATCNPNPATCDDSAGCTSQTNCCCVEQCRPLITILLTDGAETCTVFSETTSAADALLRTDVNNRRYRIETKPIGFGIAPGNSQIEGIAHAGGALDVPGLNEGFYASNEAELQLAISSILDEAIRTEVCNDLDDDCDAAVDEDFPNKGNACDNGAKGACLRPGNLECKPDGTGLQCDAPTAVCTNGRLIEAGIDIGPCGEICNNQDDDCDGKIDEGLAGCACVPQVEQCNGIDDDCDGRIDEASTNGPPLTRPCGTGTCQGVETCTFVAECGLPPGTPGCDGFTGCTAQQPTAEICDGLDNNCDGLRDGFQQACSDMDPRPPANFPVDDPRNSPGHPANSPIPENICRPGIKLCPANVGPPNSFTACGGEVKPCSNPSNLEQPAPNPAHPNPTCFDLCNGRDDDCDNVIDEDFQPQDCSDNCNVGVTTCTNGVVGCTLTPVTTDDTCDGVDDDCDMKIDEDYDCDPITPGKQVDCPCSDALTCDGELKCIAGNEVCEGTPISSESCDCSDNNCNGVKDEGNICAAGSTCNQFCQCAQPCSNTEFPCPLGKICQAETVESGCLDPVANPSCDPSDACTQDPANTNCCCRRLCITDPCFNMTCPPDANGDKQICQISQPDPNQPPIGTCVTACSVTSCAPLICIPETGQCAPDDCRTFPDRCDAATQKCINGVCVTNPCAGVTCPTDQYCVGGNCVGSCAGVDCPTGQRCRFGVCETDPCGAPCPFGQVCNDNSGECVDNLGCTGTCPVGQWCNPNNSGGTCEDDPCQISEVVCPTGQVCLGGTCFDPSDFGPDGGEVRVTAGGGGCNTGTAGSGALIGLALLLLWRSRRTGGRS